MSVVEEASCQYSPWMVVTRKKRGYKGTKQNPSLGGTTKPAGNSVIHFLSNLRQFVHLKVRPSLPRNVVPKGEAHNEAGFSLNGRTPSNSSLDFGPNLNLDTEDKPDANVIGKSGPLPSLAINKKKNPHSVRGKKILARNSPSVNSLDRVVINPFQGLASKLTSLSASVTTSTTRGTEASPYASFKFMASNDDGLGIKNGGKMTKIL